MWQRIQTVFLALTAIALLISLVQPLWQLQTETEKIVLTPFYLLLGDSYLYYPYSLTAILMVAAITVAIIEMRKFTNRPLQIKLGALNSLLLAGSMISAVAFASGLANDHPGAQAYGISLYLIFASVIFNWLAVRFIRRDERIVRDADRLR